MKQWILMFDDVPYPCMILRSLKVNRVGNTNPVTSNGQWPGAAASKHRSSAAAALAALWREEYGVIRIRTGLHWLGAFKHHKHINTLNISSAEEMRT